MKIQLIVATFMFAGFTMAQRAQAADASGPGACVPVSVFTTNNLPAAESGKLVWQAGETWSYGLAYYGKWVYAASKAEFILQFECDPATAKLTYQGATAFVGFHSDEKNPNIRCRVRRLSDGSAMLTIHHGDHKTGFMWYAIDKTTGKLTAAGKQVPAGFDHHNAPQLWTPDQQRFCVGGYFHDKIWWYRFADDGAPVADGSFALTNASPGSSSGSVMFSPDWRQMYYLRFQWPDKDPKNDQPPRIDTYAIDPATHAGAFLSSLELPFVGTQPVRVWGAIEPPSPDGRHFYVFFAGGPDSYDYVLARDPKSGALKIASQKTDPAFRGVQGAPWSRPDRFAFTADGLSGYFICGSAGGPVGRFTRDPETGALTILPPVANMGAHKLVVDPNTRTLFTVGEKIASFKVPAAENVSTAK